MMTRFLFLALVLSTCGFGERLLAQPTAALPSGRTAIGEDDVELSEISTFQNTEYVPYEILPYNDQFFLHSVTELNAAGLRGNGLADLQNLRLYRYDNNLRRSGELQVPWPNEQRDHHGLISLGNRLLWTFARYTSKAKTYEIAAEVLDDDAKLVTSHPLMKVEARDYNNLLQQEAYSANRDYYVRVYALTSPQRLLSNRDEEPALLTIVVFDRTGTQVSLIRKRLRANRDQLDVQSVAVDDNGTAYVLARVFGNSKGRETGGGSDSKVMLYDLAPGADELRSTQLKLAGQYINMVTLVPGRNGVPMIVGLYSDRVNFRQLDGYFATDDPLNGEVLKPIPFSQELLGSLGRQVTRRRRGQLVFEGEFEFLDALRLSDGRLSLLLESFRIVQDNNQGVGFAGPGAFGPGIGQLRYIYAENVVLTFGEAADLEEAFVVPKYQSTNDPNTTFFRSRLVELNGAPGVIYNDNPRNFGRPEEKRRRGLALNKALAVIATAGPGGQLSQTPLFARKEAEKVVLVPRSAERLPNGEVVFLALRYRTFGQNQVRFGRLRG